MSFTFQAFVDRLGIEHRDSTLLPCDNGEHLAQEMARVWRLLRVRIAKISEVVLHQRCLSRSRPHE